MTPMLRRAGACLLAAAALLLGACASAPPDDAGARLRRLLAASDEAMLVRNPLVALYRGDLRFAAQHGDYLSDAYIDAERAAARQDLQQLAAIDRAALPEVDRVAYDTFRWRRETDLRANDPAFVPFAYGLPITQYGGWHLEFAELSSGQGAAPYASVADCENGLARIDGFVVWLDRARERLRGAAAAGVGLPRVVVEGLVRQFDTFAAQGPADSPYLGPIRRLPADWPAAERERLARAYAAALDTRLRPAFVRMRDYLRDAYLPQARASVGLGALPGGDAWYRQRVAANTTTDLTPEAIHRLGEAEVARITAGMEAAKAEIGFAGPLPAFFAHVRSDARFKPPSAAALIDGFRAVGARVDAALPRLFAHRPRAALEIVATPSPRDRSDAAASYQGGTPDGRRPGRFFVNTWDLPSRSLHNLETLYLHEAVPGHHLQGSLAQENEALPALLRFDGNTAYVEGWALYAESLGPELGLFRDPVQRFGHLDDEMLRAMRLVVDTGLHAMGWTREQAIDYMLAHSAMSRTDATAEVERYIADPGQALAYKVGQLTIARLRARAQAALGPRFDVRDFHDQVLMTGAIPMGVLEAKIDAWVARGGGR